MHGSSAWVRRGRGAGAVGRALLACVLWVAVWAAPGTARGQSASQAVAAGAAQVGPAPQASEPERSDLPLVVAVRVKGNRRYTVEQVASAVGQEVGQRLDPAAIDEGLKRLYRSFHVRANSYLVAPQVGDQAPAGSMVLVLDVVEEPSDREPRFVGNDAIDRKTLLKWALLEDKGELYLHQAQRVRQRLLEGYLRDGFYWAEVNIVSQGGDDQSVTDVIFEIREGPRVRVKRVVVQGNASMPDVRRLFFLREGLSALAKRQLKGPSLFNWFGEKFAPETLEADVLAMRNVYRERGWLDAVVEPLPLEFDASRKHVTVRIQVDEGPRYKVGKIDVRAVEAVQRDRREELVTAELLIPAPELLAKCALKVGSFYERASVDRDREALRNAYSAIGHISHPSLRAGAGGFPRGYDWEFLDPETTFDVENHTVDVTYKLVQGKQLTVNEIKFAGISHTRDRVLRREVSQFPGELADLREINRSLARIQGTGFFSDEFHRLEHKEPYYRFEPVPGSPDAVDLVFEVEEGRVIDFAISGGVDSNEGAFGIVSLSMKNFDVSDLPRSPWSVFSEIYDKEAFHGAGQRLDLEISPGTALSRYRAHFFEPDVFRLHLHPISLDLDVTKRVRLYDTHQEDRLTSGVTLGRKVTQSFSVSAGYSYGTVDVSDLDSDGVPPLLSLQDFKGQSVLAGPTVGFALRDLDNFITPHKGYRLRGTAQFNDQNVGSDYDFTEIELSWDAYRVLGQKGDGTDIVMHVGVDGASAARYGDTIDVPYTERYFFGGNKPRGFDFRGIGPFDFLSDQPLGSESYVLGTLELYYPLYSVLQPGSYKRQEMFRGTLFLDWVMPGQAPDRIDPSDARASVGFGFGLSYPIPLTFNFGFPVIEKEGDQRRVFSFSLSLF